LIIEKFEGTPILTPGDLNYKRTSECRNGAAWKQVAPTSFRAPSPTSFCPVHSP